MSSGMAAYNTLLQISTGGETYTDVAEVNSISGPSLSADAVEITHHGSGESSDAWREFVVGLLDGGEVSIDVNFLPTDSTQADNAAGSIIYAMVERTIYYYKIIWSDDDSTEWSFQALVTGFEPDAPVDGKLGASITFKVTGSVTVPTAPAA
jgi:hypothetical protein